MTRTILRGRILTFLREPESEGDKSSYRYLEDGFIAVENGRIVDLAEVYGSGAYEQQKFTEEASIIDHRPHLLMPGFIDPHIHYSQMQIVGSYAASLLEWLTTYPFVEEQKFADSRHAARIAGAFMDEMIRVGTTTAAAFCTVHKGSVDAYFRAAAARNLLMIGGKVLMDRGAPAALTDTTQSAYDDTKDLINQWHGKGRALYAIAPRFALTSTPEQLEIAGVLAREHPDCYVETHLNENLAEIAEAARLFPDSPHYTGIYEKFGLLGPKTLLGHVIHPTDAEISLIAETRSVSVHCPTSNLFLGSGLFDRERLARAGVRTAIATDIGGGTSYSMLQTLDAAYKISQLRGGRLHPLLGFYMLTLGNARALSLEDRIGTLSVGSDADIVVLDAAATPAAALRMETVSSLAGELFLLQTLGDDRHVVETYVAGKAMKSALPVGAAHPRKGGRLG